MNASLFVTCLVDQFYPRIGESVARLLHAGGVSVDFPQQQTCCGQPAFNSGYVDAARVVALNTISAFEASEHVVCPSGSCTGMIHHYYPELFRDDAPNLERALKLRDKTYEFSQFAVHVLGRVDFGATFPHKVAYHPGCHGMRLLGLREEAHLLLREVRGIELVATQRPEECCGFGGTFAVKMAPISEAMVRAKAADVDSSGAEYLVSGDAGCLANIGGYMRRHGQPTRVLHLAELLYEGTKRDV